MPRMIPEATATLNDTNEAHTATTNTRVMVAWPGPVATNEPMESASWNTVTSPANAPVSAHTTVDTRPGWIPANRARSGSAAVARMARPHADHRTQMLSATTAAADATNKMNSPPSMRMPNHSSSRFQGVGNRSLLSAAEASGRANMRAWASWASPMVATSRITRGAVNRRRTTVNSASPKNAAPATTASTTPIQ